MAKGEEGEILDKLEVFNSVEVLAPGIELEDPRNPDLASNGELFYLIFALCFFSIAFCIFLSIVLFFVNILIHIYYILFNLTSLEFTGTAFGLGDRPGRR